MSIKSDNFSSSFFENLGFYCIELKYIKNLKTNLKIFGAICTYFRLLFSNILYAISNIFVLLSIVYIIYDLITNNSMFIPALLYILISMNVLLNIVCCIYIANKIKLYIKFEIVSSALMGAPIILDINKGKHISKLIINQIETHNIDISQYISKNKYITFFGMTYSNEYSIYEYWYYSIGLPIILENLKISIFRIINDSNPKDICFLLCVNDKIVKPYKWLLN